MAFAPPIALDYLRRAHAAGRLGHAYLLIGEEGVGFDLAARIAALVVRAGPDGALGHQDVHVVEPESKARRILIEQVRELENALRLRASAVGGRKVGILRQADRINTQAANAFLKTLEEPPADSLLLLVTNLPESLPETILSRCIKVVLQTAGSADGAPASPEDTALREALGRFARERASGAGSLPAAYGLLREFTGLLSAARARLQEGADEALEAEEERYGQTTDGAWLAEREAYHKSLVEARYVAARSRLVESLARWWGDVLRCQTAGGEAGAPEVAALAQRLPTAEVLRRLATVEELRENVDRNVQEALALEVAFLQAFGT
ncbi:MAG: hypothetical protein INR64_15490 [Caulobacteraceae bacterium]|nr:hypothetical protein [Caulobacter sp.]